MKPKNSSQPLPGAYRFCTAMKTRFCLLLGVLLWGAHLFAEQIPVYDVETQPLAAQAKRLVTAMDLLGGF